MKSKQEISSRHVILSCVIILYTVLLSPGTIFANYTIAPGFDLFSTSSHETSFMGYAFEGLPLGSFDFGGAIGVRDTYNADTIIERLDEASVPGPGHSDTIPIEIVALQLISVDPINLGAGQDYHYITLQTGSSNTGEMEITFDDENGGTFDSFFDVFFEIHIGALDGAVVVAGSDTFTTNDVPWNHTPPADVLVIPGDSNFWPGSDGECILHGAEVYPASHCVTSAQVPVPSAVVLGGIGFAVVGFLRRRKLL